MHSSQEHLYALLRLAKQRGLERVFIHCFLDGRDTPPSSAVHYVAALQKKIEEIGCGQIASLIGRYYAMDRDKRWERTQRAYDLLVKAKGERVTDPVAAVLRSYERGITDEFIEPTVIVNANGEPVATIQDGDAVIFFNFRPDRARQLTRALAIPGFQEFDVSGRPQIDFVCFTVYDRSFPLPVAFRSARSQKRFGGGLGKDLRAQLSSGRDGEVCPRHLFLQWRRREGTCLRTTLAGSVAEDCHL